MKTGDRVIGQAIRSGELVEGALHHLPQKGLDPFMVIVEGKREQWAYPCYYVAKLTRERLLGLAILNHSGRI